LADDVGNLVTRCLGGEAAAVVELVDHFRGQVYGLCFRMLGHRQDAEDMTQESFVRAIRSLDRWDPKRDFRPWLLAIAGNRCRTLLSTRKRRLQPLGPCDDDLPDPTPHPDAERHLREEVSRAVAGLREEYRRAFLLFHEQELSYQDIAAALAVPLGTVKTWVHRARRELARELLARGVVEESAYAMRGV
jgi:RNA polymerase sigma-70 factor (ECF subfamily)